MGAFVPINCRRSSRPCRRIDRKDALRELALHLMDIAENSVSACATAITIEVEEDTVRDRLWMCVRDNGKGMDAEMVKRVVDPFVTSRTTRKVGLGIPLLKAAAEMCNGNLSIQSEIGQGTSCEVDFQRSHIDRMPLGDLAGTIYSLVVAFPDIHWIFRYKVDATDFLFDDQPIKEVLMGLPLTEPTVLAYLRSTLQEGVASAEKSNE
jgi:anti-sigma regulatory factor (Ser/Thr protein kinase)